MKKTVLVLCNILVLFLLSGCYSRIDAEELKRAEHAEKDSIPIIHDHFKSKYGIDVEIQSVFAKFSGGAHDTDRCYTGLVVAVVSYNDRRFSAHVENQIVYDNYQAEEMEQACLTYASEKLGLPQSVFYKISPHYRGYAYRDFGELLVNDYFDGTNTEKIFNMISPSFILIYENDAVFDSDFSEKVTALLENTVYDKQSIELIVLEKGSADKISPIRWYEDTARHYAPYVEYSTIYRKSGNMEPETYQYVMGPLTNDLPFVSEFLILKENPGSGDFVVQQEEPPEGWDMGRKFEQITPSYHFLWNENACFLHHIFIPSSAWGQLCETYDEIHLVEYREYANGKVHYMELAMDPNYTGYSNVALYGDFFLLM